MSLSLAAEDPALRTQREAGFLPPSISSTLLSWQPKPATAVWTQSEWTSLSEHLHNGNPENHFIKIDGVAQLQENGTLSGRIAITAEGQSDAALRGLFKYSNRTAWFQNVERELLRVWPQAKVTQIKYTDPADYRNYNIWIGIDYVIPEFAMVSGKTMMLTPLSASGIFKTFQGQLAFETGIKERKYAFRDRCSRQVEINESISIPAGKKVTRMPEPENREGTVASFRGGYSFTNGSVIFAGKALYGKRVYEAQEWPEFKAAVDAQNRFSEQPVIVEL